MKQHVEDARAHGATVVCGGAPLGEGLWFAPTRARPLHGRDGGGARGDLRPGAGGGAAWTGPPRPSARRTACATGSGHRSGPATSPGAQRLAERLDYGVVSVNNHSFTGAVPSLPWSGTRATGFGVANSALALSTFVRPRTLVVDRRKDPELYWMPYDETLVELGEVLADLQTQPLRPRLEAAGA